MKPLRAIVTGGATNIGRAISEEFLNSGGRVVVGQPDVSVADSLIAKYGDRVAVLPLDVSDTAQCRQFIDAAVKLLGGLDVLVNNAAITGPGSVQTLAEVSPESFAKMVNVNVGGVLFCSQAAVPYLKETGQGVIVTISSINAIRPQRGAIVYAATKAAVTSLTQSMAKELASDRIRVVAVAPGDIRTDNSGQAEREQASRGIVSDVALQTPLGRGEPKDVAATVMFLCSDGAKFVTGTTWLVDGGLLA